MTHPMLRRWHLLSSLWIAVGLFPTAADSRGCFDAPDREEIFVAELGSAGDVEISLSGYETREGGYCSAYVDIPAARLPSLRVAPSPLALLDQVGPIAARWGAARCRLTVVVEGGEDEGEPGSCRAGEFLWSDGRWWAVDADSEC